MMIRCLLLLILSCGLTACVNLKPTPHSVKRYVLGPLTAVAEQPASTGGDLYIARPELPSYLAGNRIQYRDAGGELQSLSAAHWGEPLKDGIPRALSELVARQGCDLRLRFYPWTKSSRPASVLRVQFHQFGATADGRVQVVASWQLETNAGGVTQRGHYVAENLSWSPGQAASLVAGLNEGLALLAQQIVAAL